MRRLNGPDAAGRRPGLCTTHRTGTCRGRIGFPDRRRHRHSRQQNGDNGQQRTVPYRGRHLPADRNAGVHAPDPRSPFGQDDRHAERGRSSTQPFDPCRHPQPVRDGIRRFDHTRRRAERRIRIECGPDTLRQAPRTDRRTNLRRTGQRFPRILYPRPRFVEHQQAADLRRWVRSPDGPSFPHGNRVHIRTQRRRSAGPVRNKGSQRRDLDYDQTRFDRETQGESKSQPGMAGSGIAAQVHRLVHLCLPLQRSGQQRSRQMEPILHRGAAQCL